jgi:peptide-methionine (R)-S-oxide reductase
MKNTQMIVIATLALALGGAVWAQQKPSAPAAPAQAQKEIDWKKLSDAEWRKRLTSTQYNILRRAATEYAFRNAYHDNHKPGAYQCAGCAQELFSSETKFDSGTGWPSFYQPVKKVAVVEKRDPDGERSEVLCSRCLGHLGHVFNDADGNYGIPKTPTGLRYCMNSGAMKFIAKATGSGH